MLAYEVGIALVDEHARAVEPKAPAVIAAVEVSRRLGRNEQEHVALARPPRTKGNSAQRPMGILELLRVEGVVFGLGHLGARLRPNGNHGVEDMALRVLFEPRFLKPGTLGRLHLAQARGPKIDRIAHVVAVTTHQLFESGAAEKLAIVARGVIRAQVQHHVGSAPIPLRRAHGEALDPVASPLERRVAAQRPRDDDYFIGHHEPGIEADAELPDDFDVVVLKPFGKFGFQARRMGYSAQIAFERLGIHPNAVVAHRYGALSNV